jgi:hypothetical protein
MGEVVCSCEFLLPTDFVLGPWTEHGTAWYSCNRYDEKACVDARDAQSRSRASLERYLHVSILCSVIEFFAPNQSHTVLQSLVESRTIGEIVPRSLPQDREKDGRNADDK